MSRPKPGIVKSTASDSLELNPSAAEIASNIATGRKDLSIGDIRYPALHRLLQAIPTTKQGIECAERAIVAYKMKLIKARTARLQLDKVEGSKKSRDESEREDLCKIMNRILVRLKALAKREESQLCQQDIDECKLALFNPRLNNSSVDRNNFMKGVQFTQKVSKKSGVKSYAGQTLRLQVTRAILWPYEDLLESHVVFPGENKDDDESSSGEWIFSRLATAAVASFPGP